MFPYIPAYPLLDPNLVVRTVLVVFDFPQVSAIAAFYLLNTLNKIVVNPKGKYASIINEETWLGITPHVLPAIGIIVYYVELCLHNDYRWNGLAKEA